jgi:hypothetical protein
MLFGYFCAAGIDDATLCGHAHRFADFQKAI